MSGVKTAISIDSELFAQIEKLAAEMNFSRSKIFALAVKEFIARHKNESMLAKLNEVYAEDVSEEDQQTISMKRHRSENSESW